MGAAAHPGGASVSFTSLAEFLAMGGQGLYVWLGYSAAVIVVLANVVSLRVARRRYFRQARALEQRRAGHTGEGTLGAGANPTCGRA